MNDIARSENGVEHWLDRCCPDAFYRSLERTRGYLQYEKGISNRWLYCFVFCAAGCFIDSASAVLSPGIDSWD